MPGISRRLVLEAAAGSALSLRAAEGPLSVAFITEPGGTHLDLMVKGLAKCTGIGRVTAADPSGASFANVRRFLGPHSDRLRTFAGHKELLRAAKPDLAIITVEARHNPEIVEAALDAGSHVLCEKPPCLRLSQFESMAAQAHRQNRLLMMGFATRVNAGARQARSVIERGWMGKIYGVTMNWIGDHTRLTLPAWQKMWVSYKDRAGGGKLAFHGIHYLDLIQYLMGDRIAAVSGFCRNVGGQPIEVEDAAVLAFQFRGGAVGTLNTGYYLDKGNSNMIQIWGERGWIRFDPFLPLRWYSTHPGAPRGEQTSPNPGPDGDYDVMMDEVVRAAKGGAPFMTTDEALHVMRVIFAGYRASDTGQTQQIA